MTTIALTAVCWQENCSCMPRGRGGKRLCLCALSGPPERGELHARDSQRPLSRMLPGFVPRSLTRGGVPFPHAAFAPARVLVTSGLALARQPAVRRSVCGDLHMGKGKSAGGPNIAMRGELKKRAEMERMREQVATADVNIVCTIERLCTEISLPCWHPGYTGHCCCIPLPRQASRQCCNSPLQSS